MAGCNFKKYKQAQDVHGKLEHCDRESRKKTEHTNLQIDKTKTHLNVQSVKTLDAAYDRYRFRVKQLDETTNTNKRKDRVTAVGIVIWEPLGLKQEDWRKYFNGVRKIALNMFDRANEIASYVHFDEIHNYLDPEEGKEKTSRAHIHIYIVPELNGRLNAKVVCSRQNIIDLNNRVHEYSLKEFGLPYMDGSGKASKAKVEQLKQKSINAKLKQVDQLHTEAQKLIEDNLKTAESLKEESLEMDREKQQIRQDKAQIRTDRKAIETEWAHIHRSQRKLERDQKQLEADRDQLGKDEGFFERIQKAMQQLMDQIRQAFQAITRLKEDFEEELNRLYTMSDPDLIAIETLKDIEMDAGGTGYDLYLENKAAYEAERDQSRSSWEDMNKRKDKVNRDLDSWLNSALSQLYDPQQKGDDGFSL